MSGFYKTFQGDVVKVSALVSGHIQLSLFLSGVVAGFIARGFF